MEDNSAGVGGVFGSVDAWGPENIDKVDTRATMSVVNWGKKKNKNKKFPVIKRKMTREL
jgi:hypothetical protein